MGIKMLMAVTTLPATSHCASPHPKPPPPLAPKPNKDNIKLQKILKRLAKRKAAQTSLQPVDASDKSHPHLPKPFRSSLSPVSEASPDLEHWEHRFRSPRSFQSPKISGSPYRQGPAIVARAHVASPYPAHKSFYKGKIEILPKILISAPQSPAEYQNQAFRKVPKPMVPVQTFSIPSIQPVTKTQEFPILTVSPRFSPSFYTQRSWPGTEVPTANASIVESIILKAPVPEAHITNIFDANDVTSAAVPVFETYSVKTPAYDPPRAKTPTYDPPRAKTPNYDPPRAKTPTYDPPRTKTPNYDPPRAKTPTYDPPRTKTPTYDPPRTKTPTYDPPRARTPTYDPPRAKTPTFDPPRAKTPTYDPPRAKTPTYDPPRAKTPTYDPPRAKTPTYDPPRAKTPTYDPPRAKTPTYDPPRAKTLRNEVPQETLAKKDSNTSTMENDALTVGIGTVKLEVHHMEMTTMQKNKREIESRPLDFVAETTDEEGPKLFPKAEPQLKSLERAKPPRSKVSGWSRLKKHMVVEEEPPKFPEPEPEPSQSESQEHNQDKIQDRKQEDQKAKGSRANKMWDAVLFQMFAAKAHTVSEQDPGPDKSKQMQQATPVFSSRLPLLLFRPRFDARKLKEAAVRSLKRISSTLIESGLRRKAIANDELKDFNRTAKGWQT